MRDDPRDPRGGTPPEEGDDLLAELLRRKPAGTGDGSGAPHAEDPASTGRMDAGSADREPDGTEAGPADDTGLWYPDQGAARGPERSRPEPPPWAPGEPLNDEIETPRPAVDATPAAEPVHLAPSPSEAAAYLADMRERARDVPADPATGEQTAAPWWRNPAAAGAVASGAAASDPVEDAAGAAAAPDEPSPAAEEPPRTWSLEGDADAGRGATDAPTTRIPSAGTGDADATRAFETLGFGAAASGAGDAPTERFAAPAAGGGNSGGGNGNSGNRGGGGNGGGSGGGNGGSGDGSGGPGDRFGGAMASIAAWAKRHRKALLVAAGVVGFAALGGTAIAIGANANRPAPAASATPSAEAGRPSPDAAQEPTAVAPPKVRECSVAEAASDPRLAEMQAQVKNAATGEVLYDRGGDVSSRTASALKVLTAGAALTTLGPDYRATTTVVKGSEPGTVVLVGGGDVTLSRTPSGSETVYPGAAHLDDLVAQVRAAWAADPSNPPIQKIVLDTDYFGGPEWQPSWSDIERTYGFMPPIAALMVDGDRDDPYAEVSYRSTDPVGRAGQAFAEQLGVFNVERGSAPEGAQVLASVQSPTVAELIDKSLVVSDNTVAEMLARLVAIEVGTGNSFDAIDAAFKQALAGYRIDLSQVHFADGSGLSDDNAVPPSYFTEFFRQVEAREGDLGIIFDALPVAGVRGSLSYDDRFMGDNAEADGQVFAKTGWIETGYTLAGIIHAADGTPLTFAIYALGDVTDEAKQAIDTLTTAFYRCGDGLSNE